MMSVHHSPDSPRDSLPPPSSTPTHSIHSTAKDGIHPSHSSTSPCNHEHPTCLSFTNPTSTTPVPSSFLQGQLHCLMNAEKGGLTFVESATSQCALSDDARFKNMQPSEPSLTPLSHTFLPSEGFFPNPDDETGRSMDVSQQRINSSPRPSESSTSKPFSTLGTPSPSQIAVPFSSPLPIQTPAPYPPPGPSHLLTQSFVEASNPLTLSSELTESLEKLQLSPFSSSNALRDNLFPSDTRFEKSESIPMSASFSTSYSSSNISQNIHTLLTPGLDHPVNQSPTCPGDGSRMLFQSSVNSPMLNVSNFPSTPSSLAFPMDELNSVDSMGASISPPSLSLTPSLISDFQGLSSSPAAVAPLSMRTKSSININLSDPYHASSSGPYSHSLSPVGMSAAMRHSPTTSNDTSTALPSISLLKINPSVGGIPHAMLKRRHSDFGPISSPVTRQTSSIADLTTNPRLPVNNTAFQQSHLLASSAAPSTGKIAHSASSSWNMGLSNNFFVSPKSNINQKSNTSSSWTSPFKPDEAPRESDIRPEEVEECTSNKQTFLKIPKDGIVRPEKPTQALKIPSKNSFDEVPPPAPVPSTPSSLQPASPLPPTSTRYLKISNISASFPNSEKSRLFQSLSEVQHMEHRLVGSNVFSLYLSFYDSRQVVQFLQNMLEPSLKSIIMSHSLVMQPITLTEYQEATGMKLSETESCSELIIRGVTTDTECLVKDLLMFYGEIMSLQRVQQSGCLIVNFFDVRSAEKAFLMLPNLARSLHQIEVTIERPAPPQPSDPYNNNNSTHSKSRVNALKVEASRLEGVSYLDAGLLQSINKEQNSQTPQSPLPSSPTHLSTFTPNSNTNAPTKSHISTTLPSNTLSSATSNLCEPVWPSVYPTISRRATEMPYSLSQQHMRNSFLCKTKPAATAAEEFPTTSMDDFLIKPPTSDLTSSMGPLPTPSSYHSADARSSCLNSNDSFFTEQVISTRCDVAARSRDLNSFPSSPPQTGYPPAPPPPPPPPPMNRSNPSLRTNSNVMESSGCTANCKHTSHVLSGASSNHLHHHPPPNQVSYPSGPIPVSGHASQPHSMHHPHHNNHSAHPHHHHHHHHLRHHHNNHHHHSMQSKKTSNYGYSTCLRSNSALPKIDLIPRENEFELSRIMDGKDPRTTIMIRNIPNKYSQQMLLDFINETHKGQYDFLYLRMDFKNRCNVGYAFCNLVDVNSLCSFAQRVVGKKWTRFNSDKVCMLSYANIQGKQALIEKFRNSSVMDEHPSYRPKIFNTSGPLAGGEEVFPLPVNKLSRYPPASSSSACEGTHLSNRGIEYNQESPNEEKQPYYCDYSTPVYSQYQDYSPYPPPATSSSLENASTRY